MEKSKLGGIKFTEGCSFLSSAFRCGENALAGICYRLAGEQINAPLLMHEGEHEGRGGITSICTDARSSFSSYFLLKLDHGSSVRMQPEVSMISVFPHNERAEVLGAVFQALAQRAIQPLGFASSPSAMTVLLPSAHTEKAIDGLFDAFEFSSYKSPLDWHAAYRGKESILKEIVCSYQEKMIRVYNVASRANLEMVRLAVLPDRLERFAKALDQLGRMGARMPFIIGQTGKREELVVFCSLCDRSHKTHYVAPMVMWRSPNRPVIAGNEKGMSAT